VAAARRRSAVRTRCGPPLICRDFVSSEPSARPPKWPSATILQPKSVRFDATCWGRLVLGGTAVAGGGRLTSSADVRYSHTTPEGVTAPPPAVQQTSTRDRCSPRVLLRIVAPGGVPGLLPGVSASLPERPESRDGVDRTDDSTPICRFCRFCHRPARAGVGPRRYLAPATVATKVTRRTLRSLSSRASAVTEQP